MRTHMKHSKNEYSNLAESIDQLMKKFSVNFNSLTEGKLNMSKATVVKINATDSEIDLNGEVFGIRNDNEIVAFLLEALGVPMDGMAIKIRAGFMQYDKASKMLFIARYKSDLPNNHRNKIKESVSLSISELFNLNKND